MSPPGVVPGSNIRDSEPVNLANGFSGFSTTAFCIPERYVPYLDKVLVSNGMIKDRWIQIFFRLDRRIAKNNLVEKCSVVHSCIRPIDNAMPIKDKNILIVDDICDTGKTMVKLSDYLTEAGAKSVMTCCLLLKHTKLNIGYRPDFLGFEIPDQFIVGYAIDYNECFRDLSHICSINEKAKLSFTSHSDIELGKLPAPTL
ncbi:hypoxanthine guanine phosphoribosyltransferase [Echinococcus multilocularis]|uniref:Hypoxanthine guanine phosphoribosyltransferase n=1 Tax=Echinococcus multilocularis TaxID=6211 RepID=A0A068Y6A8_ECHMU|nr:hypoxanthine guanine phosphoribosyltransferase [Echinococcus multilocularis]